MSLPPAKRSMFKFISYIIKLVLALAAITIVLALAFPIGFYGMSLYLAPSLPSLDEIKTAKPKMPLQIYTADNQLIGAYGNQLSLPVVYEDVPKPLIGAFLAAEDAEFFKHEGISVMGLGRAVTQAVSQSEDQTGGSTITMQVAKNYFLTPARTFERKLTELFLARKIEDNLSKKEIFTLYVNKIYLGEGAYGIRAAAKKYYSKNLDELSIAQMAMLAGLPKAPSAYNPVANPERALTRRNWILKRMYMLGAITQQDYEMAKQEPINLNLYKITVDMDYGYLAELARYALVSQFGESVISSGWKVRLTVSSDMQQKAQQAVRRGLHAYDRRHGYRGSEATDEPLSKFQRYGDLYPAKVTQVNKNSFDALLASGESVTVPWSSMRWAKKHYSANRVGRYPSRPSQLVEVGDIVRIKPNPDKSGWLFSQLPKVQGSLVSLDPDSGALIALVGGYDYRQSKFNRATQGYRQPGSIIKPIIYTLALEKGYRPNSLVSDNPLNIGGWKPKNSDGRYLGMIPLSRALYLSRNLVSVRLLRSVGIGEARSLMDQFGLEKSKLPSTPSLALGAGQALPLQMTTAYATFANGGHRIQPYFIDQIYGQNDQLLYLANPSRACSVCYNQNLEEKIAKANEQAIESDTPKEEALPNTVKDGEDKEQMDEAKADKPLEGSATFENDRLTQQSINYLAADQAPRIVSARSAFDMANILRDVIRRGTGRAARKLGRQDIAGKTGTTNNFKDAWFAGFQTSVATVVWVGFDKPSTLGRREYGGTAALPIWIDFMGFALEDKPTQWLTLGSNKGDSGVVNMTRIIEISSDGDSSDNGPDDVDKAIAKQSAPNDELLKDIPKAYVIKRPAPKPRRRKPAPQRRSQPKVPPKAPKASSQPRPVEAPPNTATLQDMSKTVIKEPTVPSTPVEATSE